MMNNNGTTMYKCILLLYTLKLSENMLGIYYKNTQYRPINTIVKELNSQKSSKEPVQYSEAGLKRAKDDEAVCAKSKNKQTDKRTHKDGYATIQ